MQHVFLATLYDETMTDTKIKTTKIGNRTYTDSLAYEVKLTEKYSKMLCLQLFSRLNASVSPEEFLVLDVTYHNPDICQRDLAKLLIKDRANTGRLLESLEKKSLIKRVVDVKNNRLVKKIILTNEGEGILFSLWEKINPVFTKTFESFTDEEVEFTKKILKKMRDTLKETVEVQI